MGGLVSRAVFVVSLLLLLSNLSEQRAHAQGRLTSSVVYLQIEATEVGPVGQTTTLTGSGVLITKQGHVLTAAHNVPERAQPGLYKSSRVFAVVGTKFGFPIELDKTGLFNEDEDIAILKFPSVPNVIFEPAVTADIQTIKAGDRITVISFPLGLDISPQTGSILNLSGPGGRIVIDVNVQRGSSGGPGFDASGRLVGIVSSGFEDPNTGQLTGLNSLIPVSSAKSIAGGLEWLTESEDAPCRARPLQLWGDNYMPDEGASEPLSIVAPDVQPEQLEGLLASEYPWIVLQGGKVRIGSLEGVTPTFRLCRLELRSGAKLLVGASPLRLLVDDLVSSNGSIVAFEEVDDRLSTVDPASPGEAGRSGNPGRSGGAVLLAVLRRFDGVLNVQLDGTHGTQGGRGGAGASGAAGAPGHSGSDSLFDCKRGPGNGEPGKPGQDGGPGGAGGSGGNGGDLNVITTARVNLPPGAIRYSAEPGRPGAGGEGGSGGKGGPGGKSGSETFYCRGGRDGPDGPSGTTGPGGPDGSDGTPGKITISTIPERQIIDLFR